MTRIEARQLGAKIIKDIKSLFEYIDGIDMACDEAIDWGKMAEMDREKTIEALRVVANEEISRLDMPQKAIDALMGIGVSITRPGQSTQEAQP